MTIEERTRLIRNKAYDLGFMFVGFSKAEFLEEEAKPLEKWLLSHQHGKMQYMENHFDKRLDPTLLVDGAKSVISLAYNYFPSAIQTSTAPKVAKYAYGEDYHYVIKDKLKVLFEFIEQEIGAIQGRIFVDSAPVLEKAWAKKSGLGWVGKNTNIIHPKVGSFFFLAEMILDLDLLSDGPIKDYCGRCTRCIDACPTEALTPYQIDASKCISYLTIELKDEMLPNEFKGKMDNWVFGCDICQDVCPWNRFSKPHEEARFSPSASFLAMNEQDWLDLSEEQFKILFKNTPLQRTKWRGLSRNIAFLDQK